MGITPAEARATLNALLGRSTEQNTTAEFRSAIEQAIGAIDRDELVSAATIIDMTAAQVSGEIHDCAEHQSVWTGDCPLQADENETHAYDVLCQLRYTFGVFTVGRHPSNVYVMAAE